jgi:hypothetical protein
VGLEVVALEAYGGYPDVLLDLACKGLGRQPAAGRAAATLAGRVGRLGAVARLRRRTGATFPLGYVVVARREGFT